MTDTCSIVRNFPGGLDSNGFPVVGPSSAVYSGKCFLQEKRLQNTSPGNVAADYVLTETFTLKRPATAAPVSVGDVVTMTGSGDSARGWIVGFRLRVTALNPATQKKTLDAQVEAIVG
jgi:hypothetical protein